MDFSQQFQKWYDEHLPQIKEDYFQFLRFRSVSTDDAYREEVLSCADFLVQYLRKGGLNAELVQTTSYPIVYAEDLSAGEKAPTLLIYGHYDVQPPEPLDLWISPPFEPTERDGKIFARGASDNKGQILYATLALIAWKSLKKQLPVNVKFCIEGEEESQSKGLSTSLPDLKEKLKTDALLIVDFDSSPNGTPFVTLGARGCLAMEVTLTGSNKDLHSGLMGGLAYNPNRALAQVLGSLWDKNGRVTVPGFYDDVEAFSDLENTAFPFTEDSLREDFGIEALGNEKGKSLRESNWLRPTLEINGMVGGYTGEGSKTVIPAKASAKISCRLVLNQDPEKIIKAIEAFFKEQAPKGMRVDVVRQGIAFAYRSKSSSSLAKAVNKASAEVTGKKAAYVYSGASIPIAAEFARVLGVEAIGMGYCLASDQIHAPNEHFDMDRFEKGFLTVARIFERL